jgi:predicted nucleotidyltransferase
VSQPLVDLVVSVLTAMGARHALIGAAALAAHGVARSTYDVDLLTTDAAVLDAGAWNEVVAACGCEVEVRRGDPDDPLAGVVRVRRPGEPDVDVVVGRWAWQADAIERAEAVSLGSVRVPVVRAADLVLLKLYAGGTQDLWDVEQLLAAGDRGAMAASVDAAIDRLPPEARRAWASLQRGR